MRPASPATERVSRADTDRKAREAESQAARDRLVLRERAERLIRAAHATDDAASRNGLILQAAMLHRLATVLEAEPATFQERGVRLDAEPRSFAEPRRERLN